MKNFKRIILNLTLVILLLTQIVQAATGWISLDNGRGIYQDINIYYLEDLEVLGYGFRPQTFQDLDSQHKNQVKTKMEAYFYKNGLRPLVRLEGVTSTDQAYQPEKAGYYLLTFDKQNLDGKILSTNSVLIYYDGRAQHIQAKSALIDSAGLEDLEVLLEWDLGEEILEEVWVGLYDKEGRLVDKALLSKDKNWRHIFEDLDPLQDYGIWIKDSDGMDFTMERNGNRIIIRNIKRDQDQGPDTPIWPHWSGPILPLWPEPQDPGQQDLDLEVSGQEDRGQDPSPGQEEVRIPEGDRDIRPEEGPGSSSLDQDLDGPNPQQKGDKLPQTGQVWWPLPILLALGIFFLILGLRREDHD